LNISDGGAPDQRIVQVERGSFGSVPLEGLAFIVLAFTPEEMGKGNWSVGLVIDERASAERRDAITALSAWASITASIALAAAGR
jgi:hypothetical protein